jgi:hypothetical protein
MLGGAEALAALHAAELPQKDELCGAFWGALALRLGGRADVDQDAVAAAAGTVLSHGPHAEMLPPGEPGRRDYRLTLPAMDDPARSGTAIAGVLRAIRELSDDALDVVPVAGPWDVAAVRALLDAAADAGPVTAIANVGTRFLWGSRPTPAQMLAYLETGAHESGPPPDWDVGHYVGLLGSIAGRSGTLVVVADTYPSLGRQGVHVQPIERVAAALRREGMTPGGAALAVAAAAAPRLAERLAGAGLRVELWDNGSPDDREGADAS